MATLTHDTQALLDRLAFDLGYEEEPPAPTATDDRPRLGDRYSCEIDTVVEWKILGGDKLASVEVEAGEVFVLRQVWWGDEQAMLVREGEDWGRPGDGSRVVVGLAALARDWSPVHDPAPPGAIRIL